MMILIAAPEVPKQPIAEIKPGPATPMAPVPQPKGARSVHKVIC